ncbi:MAG: zinc-ribbon domain-containing protein [Ruminococcaceae bacterium]|nr:zinc-ribbon domain-containing protein [Oscillospiraceae bacterium]
MKYCTHCGAQMHDEAVICIKCGCSVAPQTPAPVKEKDDTMEIVVKVLMILSCIAQGWLLIPLAWCIPMTVSVFHSFRDNKPISTGMKVCVLLFVNLISGILLLCMKDD